MNEATHIRIMALVLFAGMVLVGAFMSYREANHYFLANASNRWNSSEGKIRKVEYGVPIGLSGLTSRIQYEYQVKGVWFTGNRVSWYDGSPVKEFIEAFSVPPQSGQPVRVYYDPEAPKRSVLRVGFVTKRIPRMIFPVLMVIFGLLVLRNYIREQRVKKNTAYA